MYRNWITNTNRGKKSYTLKFKGEQGVFSFNTNVNIMYNQSLHLSPCTIKIIKVVNIFIKTIFESLTCKKSLKNWKLSIKMQSVSVFLDVDFQWKITDVSRTQGVCHVIHIFFWFSLVNWFKFHACRICRVNLFLLSARVRPSKQILCTIKGKAHCH